MVLMEGQGQIDKLNLDAANKKLCREVFGSVCEQTYALSSEDAQEEPEVELQLELTTTTVAEIQREMKDGTDKLAAWPAGFPAAMGDLEFFKSLLLREIPDKLYMDDFMRPIEAAQRLTFSYRSVHYLDRVLMHLQQRLGLLFNLVRTDDLVQHATCQDLLAYDQVIIASMHLCSSSYPIMNSQAASSINEQLHKRHQWGARFQRLGLSVRMKFSPTDEGQVGFYFAELSSGRSGGPILEFYDHLCEIMHAHQLACYLLTSLTNKKIYILHAQYRAAVVMNSFLYLVERKPNVDNRRDNQYLRCYFTTKPPFTTNTKEAVLRTLYSVAYINDSGCETAPKEVITAALMRISVWFPDLPRMRAFQLPSLIAFRGATPALVD